MTSAHDLDGLLRSYLADAADRVELEAPPLEVAVQRLAPSVTGLRTPLDRRLTVLLVAALLAAMLIATVIVIGSRLVELPFVVDRAPASASLVIGDSSGQELRTRELSSRVSRPLFRVDANVTALAVSPDGTFAAYLTRDTAVGAFNHGELWVLDLDADTTPTLLAEGRSFRNQVDWAADARRIAMLTSQTRVAIFDARTLAPEFIDLPGQLRGAEVQWHPNGTVVFIRDEAQAVHALDLHSRALREVLPPSDGARPAVASEAMGVSSDGRRLALVLQQEIVVIDLEGGRSSVWQPGGVIVAGALSPDGTRVAAVMEDRVLVASADGRMLHDVEIDIGMPIHVPDVEFSPDSSRLLIAPGWQSRAWVIDAEQGRAEEIAWDREGGQLVRWRPELSR